MENQKTILLVEDDEMLAIMEYRVITRSNYKVIITDNGTNAVEEVKNNPEISLILMDINLKNGTDGTEAAEEILKIKEIPIVFLTSHAEQEMVDKVKGITKYGYVLKNSGEFVLLESINMAYELFEAKQRLKNSEEKYRNVVENQTEIICRFYPDGTIIFVNDIFCRILGRTCDDLIGKKWQIIVFSDDINFIESQFNGFSQDHPVIVIENRIKTSSGELRWIQFVNKGLFDANGKLIEIQSVGRDISERKKAEDALRESEEKFRTVFEEGQIGITIASPDLKFTNANHTFCRMIGYSVDELKNMSFKNITVSERLDIDIKNIEALTRGDISVYKTEKQYKKKNGDILWGKLATSIVRDADDKILYYVAMIEDITERKIAEQALNESEERYRLITEITTDYFFKLKVKENNDIEMDYVSYNFTEITGRTLEDVKDISSWSNILYHEDLPKAYDLLKQILLKGEKEDIECRSYINEEIRWIKIFVSPQKDKLTGRVTGILGAIKDISDSKFAEQALRESEEKFKAFFDNSIVGKSITLVSGKIQTNKAFCDMLGYTQAEIANIKWQDLTHPDDIELTQKYINILLSGERESMRFEKRFIHKNMSTVWVDLSSSLQKDIDGKPLYLITTIIDITKQKKSEQVLMEKQKFIEMLIESLTDGISVIDRDGKIILINKAFSDITGYTKEELLNTMPPYPICPPEEVEKIIKAFDEIKKGELDEKEFIFMKKNKERFPVLLTPSIMKDNTGKIISYIITFKDMTGYKIAEQSLKAEEAKNKTLIENINIGIFISTHEGKLLLANSFLAHKAGYNNVNDFMQINLTSLYENPYNRQYFINELKKKGFVKNFEVLSVRKDGTKYWISISAVLLKDEITGNDMILGSIIDISDRKMAEDSLELLRCSLDSSLNGAYWMDIDGRFIYVNEAGYKALGYTREELLNMTIFDINPTATSQVWNEVWKMLREKKRIIAESIHKRKDGSTFPVEINSIYVKFKDKEYCNGFARDITNSKKIEDDLKLSEEKFSKVFSVTPAAMTLVSMRDGKYIEVNDFFLNISGYSREEIIGYTADEINFWCDIGERDKYLSELKIGSRVRNYEAKFKIKSGEIRDCAISSEIVNVGNDKCILSLIIDITDKKKFDEKNKLSEEKYRDLAEKSHALICEIDSKGNFLYINSAYKDILGYESQDLIGHSAFEIGNPGQIDNAKDKLNSSLDHEKRQVNEWQFVDKWNKWHWFNCYSNTFQNSEGETRINVVSFDITQRKQNELEIKKLLSERDILLNEVHHRIKNDMNIISSLLSIQISDIDDPITKNILIEAQSRINVMYNIYNELYKKKDFNVIFLKKYVFDLIGNIKYLYSMLSNANIEFHIDDISIDRNIAFPVGMIVNELVTNAFKYAFIEKRENADNRISISIYKKNKETLVINVNDNGKGYPESILKKKSNGFGMQLINMLSEQFEGQVTFYNKDGAVCEFVIIIKQN